MRRALNTLAVVVAAAAAGCGRDGGVATPAACTEGPAAVRSALARAPGRVELDGVRLSECLTSASDGADIQSVGTAYVETAAVLSPRAQRRPEGPEALQLGYLVGAVRRGAARTQGVQAELLRRLEQELALVDTRARAFRRGERAGRSLG